MGTNSPANKELAEKLASSALAVLESQLSPILFAFDQGKEPPRGQVGKFGRKQAAEVVHDLVTKYEFGKHAQALADVEANAMDELIAPILKAAQGGTIDGDLVAGLPKLADATGLFASEAGLTQQIERGLSKVAAAFAEHLLATVQKNPLAIKDPTSAVECHARVVEQFAPKEVVDERAVELAGKYCDVLLAACEHLEGQDKKTALDLLQNLADHYTLDDVNASASEIRSNIGSALLEQLTECAERGVWDDALMKRYTEVLGLREDETPEASFDIAKTYCKAVIEKAREINPHDAAAALDEAERKASYYELDFAGDFAAARKGVSAAMLQAIGASAASGKWDDPAVRAYELSASHARLEPEHEALEQAYLVYQEKLAELDPTARDHKFTRTYEPLVKYDADPAVAAQKRDLIRHLMPRRPANDDVARLGHRLLAALPEDMLASLVQGNASVSFAPDRVQRVMRNAKPLDDATLRRGNKSTEVVVRVARENGELRVNVLDMLQNILTGLIPSNSRPAAMFFLDPERGEKVQRWDQGPKADYDLAKIEFSPQQLADLQHAMVGTAIVNADVDLRSWALKLEERNGHHENRWEQGQAYVLEMSGPSDLGQHDLAREIGSELRRIRHRNVARFDLHEDTRFMSAADFNDPQKVEEFCANVIAMNTSELLVLEDLANIPPDSKGFDVLAKFSERFGDMFPVVLMGDDKSLERYRDSFPRAVRKRAQLKALEPVDMARAIVRLAHDNGWQLDLEARQALASAGLRGTHTDCERLWSELRAAALMRELDDPEPASTFRVKAIDIGVLESSGSGGASPSGALGELDGMVGMEPVKTELNAVLQQKRMASERAQHGLRTKTARLNLLFAGEPGTGKTTAAKAFVDQLANEGHLANKNIEFVKIDALVEGHPEDNVRKLFKKNKGGAIFLDEMHQLADSREGRRVLRAMIPYLSEIEYRDTVFIGAGYTDELKHLIREIDPGAERRFGWVNFPSYDSEQLGQILDSMVATADLTMSDSVRTAALNRLEVMRRSMKHFGNAGSVEQLVEKAVKKQGERLSRVESALTKEQHMELHEADFVEPVRYSIKDVWKELDALGIDGEVKARLVSIEQTVDRNRRKNRDLFDNVEPYFVVQGDPGTGKGTTARVLVKFFHALGLLPTDSLIERSGASLQGEFVGQTDVAVRKLFEDVWGGGLFLDEIAGLARAGGTFKDEVVKELLMQLENYRGRFMVVVADYPKGIDHFLAMDSGLPRRFVDTNRLHLERWSHQRASDLLVEQLTGTDEMKLEKAAPLIRRYMAQLRDAPDWASGGDVRTVRNALMQEHNLIASQHAAQGKAFDPDVLFPEAVAPVFRRMLAKRQPREAAPVDTAPTATSARAAVQEASEKRAVPKVKLTRGDHAMLATLQRVDKEFADAFNNDPKVQQAAQNDSSSDYIKRLAAELNEEPEQVMTKLARLDNKLKKLMTIEETVQRFVYHCPYCGGVDSPSCGYINQPLEWKIAHSLRKPWTESVTREVEVEIDPAAATA